VTGRSMVVSWQHFPHARRFLPTDRLHLTSAHSRLQKQAKNHAPPPVAHRPQAFRLPALQPDLLRSGHPPAARPPALDRQYVLSTLSSAPSRRLTLVLSGSPQSRMSATTMVAQRHSHSRARSPSTNARTTTSSHSSARTARGASPRPPTSTSTCVRRLPLPLYTFAASR
jgi:hypothetical protein